MNDIRVLLIFLCRYPHLATRVSIKYRRSQVGRTFLKVLRPARIEPPIQVEYLRSGGAYILILTSLSASFLTSFSRRSPNPSEIPLTTSTADTRHKPLQRVLPPLRTMFENKLLRRSRSTLLIESTTTWCTPAYSWPISSGLNRISGARKRSEPSYRNRMSVFSMPGHARCTDLHDVTVRQFELF